MFIEQFPNEMDLLIFFENEPFYKNIDDMGFTYKFYDNNGLCLIFSYNIIGGWMQSIIEYNGIQISQYLTENVRSFKLENDIIGEYLSSEITFNDTITRVEIRLKPYISVKWNTLVK